MEKKEVIIASISVIAVLLFIYVKVIYFSNVFADEVIVEEHEEIVEVAPEPVQRQETEPVVVEEGPEQTPVPTPVSPKGEELEPGLRTLHYTVSDFPTGDYLYEVFMNATHWKIHYADRQIYNRVYFDTVYLDVKNQRAVGYCEDKGCKYPEDGVILVYSQYQIITPMDWKDRVAAAEEKQGTYVNGKDTIYKAQDDIQVWFDTFYGLPLKVQEGSSEPAYFIYYDVNNPALDPAPKQGFEIEGI